MSARSCSTRTRPASTSSRRPPKPASPSSHGGRTSVTNALSRRRSHRARYGRPGPATNRRRTDMTTDTATASLTARLLHRPARTGKAYWGPGDLYTFLVTGEESGGHYFAMEALVPTGGGPPPHIHGNEDETFYVLEGQCSFHLRNDTVVANPGDFVSVPRGTVHCFRNDGRDPARIIL